MSKDVSQTSMELCIKCKKYETEMDSDPYCEGCWKLTKGYLLQIPPLKVLSVINECEKTYKQIMAHHSLKSFHDISPTSVGIPLRSLMRRKLIHMPNRISGMYSITEHGVTVLDHMEN
jgi:hypothetical protein